MIENKILTKEEKSILMALCLGDGHIRKPLTGNAQFECTHSIKQQAYITWKRDLVYKILGGFKTPKLSKKTVTLKSINKSYEAIRFCKVHSYFTYLRKLLYNDNVKQISKEVLDMLSPQGLAIWFMDDGWGVTIKDRKGNYTNRLELGIATDSFTKEENEAIIEAIYNKFNIKFRLGLKYSPSTRQPLWFIRMKSKNEVNKFIELVTPYMIPQMMYKVTPKQDSKIHECETSTNVDEDIV